MGATRRRLQTGFMEHSQGSGPYRVRAFPVRECSVPEQTEAMRFDCRDAADLYARAMAHHRQLCVIVEKLAPGGCWLQLSSVG